MAASSGSRQTPFADDTTAYVHAEHRGADGNGDFLERFGARFEQRDGAWRIADRVVIVEWSDVAPVTEIRGTGRFVRGLRNRDDLAYRHEPRDPEAPLPRYRDTSK